MESAEEENDEIEKEIKDKNFCNIGLVDKTRFRNSVKLIMLSYKDNLQDIKKLDYMNWEIPNYIKAKINKGEMTSSFLDKLNQLPSCTDIDFDKVTVRSKIFNNQQKDETAASIISQKESIRNENKAV